MPQLRSLIFFFGQVLSAVLLCPFVLLCGLLPSVPRARLISSWARLNVWLLEHLCGITCEVTGAEHIPARPAVLIANHQSAWETIYFQLVFPPQSCIMKKQLLWIPFFGWGLAVNRPVAINRSKKVKALEQLLKLGAARLEEGRWVVAFPEGTRMPPGHPGEFQPGGALLAAKTGAPVVPVAHNAGVFWPKRSLIKHPGVIRLHIGKPIESKGKKARQINAEARAWITGTLETLPRSR